MSFVRVLTFSPISTILNHGGNASRETFVVDEILWK